jgi:hypothetical protein
MEKILVRVGNQPFFEPRGPTNPLTFGLWWLNFCGLPKVYGAVHGWFLVVVACYL